MNHPVATLTTARLLGALLFCATSALELAADVTPSALFQDHAVLQRDKPVPVWGKAEPGEAVKVRFGTQELATVTGPDGKWRVDLAPMPASATPATLVISGRNTITLSDVLVGDLWLASGQSNMELSVDQSNDADLIKRTAVAFPAVREIKVKRKVSATPVDTFAGEWKPAAPETVGAFSAVAHTFGRELHTALQVPIGIVHTSWGGTPVESWISPAALATTPHADKVRERWKQVRERYPAALADYRKRHAEWQKARAEAHTAKRAFTQPEPRGPQGPDSPHQPNALYNGMLHPLLPCALRGFLWYQGESNAARPAEYADLFPAMIQGWRSDFGQGDLTFLWVQLAAFRHSVPEGLEWPALREAQSKTLALPATGQAVAMDLGDYTDIHPRAKAEVGRRLARLALRRTYGDASIADSGPVYAGIEVVPADPKAQPPTGASITVNFTNTERGLRHPDIALAGFEIAGEDKVFHPAVARIRGKTVNVSSPDVPAPVAVRYAWRNFCPSPLHDDLGLPTPPFRSDAW